MRELNSGRGMRERNEGEDREVHNEKKITETLLKGITWAWDRNEGA
jgi:hypothetical protein